jgi:ferredoxin
MCGPVVFGMHDGRRRVCRMISGTKVSAPSERSDPMKNKRWSHDFLLYDSAICQYFGRKRDACTRCVSVCPNNALHAGDGGISIDPDACTGCGDCVSVCPSGALTLKSAVRRQLDAALFAHAGDVIVLCRESVWMDTVDPALQTGERVLPRGVEPVLPDRIGVVSETDIVRAIMASGRPVVVLAPGERALSRPFLIASDTVARITDALFLQPLVRIFTDLDAFWQAIGEIANAPGCPVPPSGKHAQRGVGKRQAFGEILDSWLRASDTATSKSAQPVVIPHDSYATITCERDRCILCGACANHCKVQSLRIVSGGTKLVQMPLHCLNCGACVTLCPHDALSLEPGLSLAHDFLAPRELARTDIVRCTDCDRPYTTSKRVEMVSSILRETFGDDHTRSTLRSLCPECRAKKAFTNFADWKEER